MTDILKKALCGGGKKSKEEIFGKIHMIAVNLIYPSPSQPRRSFDDEKLIRLADSIMKYGVLQPLTVRFNAESAYYSDEVPPKQLHYELIAGERRLRAAKMAGLKQVPCIMINADYRRSAEISLIENIQREELNVFEQATAISMLMDIYNLTQEQVAKALSLSQPCVANKLRLLNLTLDERKLIISSPLTERHCRAALKLSDPAQRLRVFETAVKKELNVAQTEELVDQILYGTEKHSQDPKQMCAIKDIRLCYNTIDRAISTIEKAGINVTKEKYEDGNYVEFIIRINKQISDVSENVSRETKSKHEYA